MTSELVNSDANFIFFASKADLTKSLLGRIDIQKSKKNPIYESADSAS